MSVKNLAKSALAVLFFHEVFKKIPRFISYHILSAN